MGDLLRLAVLNPGGTDADQSFPNGAEAPAENAHPPVNYHAYAACTRGSFHRHVAGVVKEALHAPKAPDARSAVLVLLRRDLKLCLKSLLTLQANGYFVAV